MINYHATAATAIILIIFVGMAEITPLQGLINPVAASAGSGYICRQTLNTQYHSDSDIRPVYVGYYSQGGHYVPKPVNIIIQIKYAGDTSTIRTINASINDNGRHAINIGRLAQGTYTIAATFTQAEITLTGNIEIKHPPIKYIINLNGGDFIRFKTMAPSHNFTVSIYQQAGQQAIIKEYINTSGFKWTPPENIVTITIYIIDEYGNINGMNDGQPYVWVYTHGIDYKLYRTIGITIIAIFLIIVFVAIWRRTLWT